MHSLLASHLDCIASPQSLGAFQRSSRLTLLRSSRHTRQDRKSLLQQHSQRVGCYTSTSARR